jgi:hypothetical protein
MRLRRKATTVGGTPRVVVLTVARDEATMLPRWVRHYGDQVGLDNLVVVDDNTRDGSTDALPCPVLRVPGFPPERFEERRIKLVSGLAQGLLNSYDVAVFTDVDEFLVPDPARHDGLLAYLESRSSRTVMAPLTLNVLHDARCEEPLDPQEPVLGQRRFAKFAPVMCKPAIKRVPAAWRFASHGIDARYDVDPELFMVHLKFADTDLLRRVAESRHQLALADGRGINASWKHSGDEMAAMVAGFVGDADPAAVPEFDPGAIDLKRLVIERDGAWRAAGRAQVTAMTNQPLVRIPERLHGLV